MNQDCWPRRSKAAKSSNSWPSHTDSGATVTSVTAVRSATAVRTVTTVGTVTAVQVVIMLRQKNLTVRQWVFAGKLGGHLLLKGILLERRPGFACIQLDTKSCFTCSFFRFFASFQGPSLQGPLSVRPGMHLLHLLCDKVGTTDCWRRERWGTGRWSTIFLT